MVRRPHVAGEGVGARVPVSAGGQGTLVGALVIRRKVSPLVLGQVVSPDEPPVAGHT